MFSCLSAFVTEEHVIIRNNKKEEEERKLGGCILKPIPNQMPGQAKKKWKSTSQIC
jgi:hypothetical protein